MLIYPDNYWIDDEENYKNPNDVDDIISKSNHVFILVYMNGCGPCNSTKPEWYKMQQALKQEYADRDDVGVVAIEKSLIPQLKSNLGPIDGFPTMKYIEGNGKNIQMYEDSPVRLKDRSKDSFVNWVESVISPASSGRAVSSTSDLVERITPVKKRKSMTTKNKNSKNKNNKNKNNKNKTKKSKKLKKTKKNMKKQRR